MVFIDLPRTRRKRRTLAVGPAVAVAKGAKVIGIEVTQAIQNLKHEVRLIAGKTTVARVYLDPRGLSANARISGEIVVSKSPGAPGTYVASSNQISLKATGHPSLADQRNDAELSLNFVLPTADVGPQTVRFNRAIPVAGGDDLAVLPGTTSYQSPSFPARSCASEHWACVTRTRGSSRPRIFLPQQRTSITCARSSGGPTPCRGWTGRRPSFPPIPISCRRSRGRRCPTASIPIGGHCSG